MVSEDAGTPLASCEPNRQRLAHRRLAKQTPLRLSTTAPAAATSPAIHCNVLAKRGWLDVRASGRLGNGRLFCVLPTGGSRLEFYRNESDSRAVRSVDLTQCACIHAEEPVADRWRGKPAALGAVDFHFCLGTTEGSVLFWSSPAEGPSWISALQEALNGTPAFKQSPPPNPLVGNGSSPNAVAAPPTPVRSSPCVAPTTVRRLAVSSLPAVASSQPAEEIRRQPETSGASCDSSVVAPPTWLPDDEVTECPLCTKSFGFFLRRHHCRRCGGVFCSACSDNTVELPMFGIGGQHRVCNDCYSCHQDEQRLVWSVTRQCAPDKVEVSDAAADSNTLALVNRIASTPPCGRLEWCTSQHGESILALAAYGPHNEKLITAILEAQGQLESAAALVDSRDPVALRGALHVACYEGNEGALRALLSHFSSSGQGISSMKRLLSGTDKYGHTPVDLAERRGHDAASQLCQAWLQER